MNRIWKGCTLGILVLVQSEAGAVAPGVAGVASIVPGLGQAIQGNVGEGLGWFLSTVSLLSFRRGTVRQVGFTLWQYNLYDAYRDAGAKPSAPHNVWQNWVANLNPLNLLDPVGAPIVGLGAAAGASHGYPGLRSPERMLMYSFVGLGEEALFRGFVFPAFTDIFFDSVWIGAVTSSAFFSWAHVVGGRQNLGASPLTQRFLMGLLFAWQTHRNQYDLRKSIFAHTWFDIFVDRGDVGARLEFRF